MKQANPKLKVTSREIARDRSAGLPGQSSEFTADPSEQSLLEKSPWLAEIQNALSPYWSARLAR